MNSENILIIPRKILRSVLAVLLGLLMTFACFAILYFDDFFEVDDWMRAVSAFGVVFFALCTLAIIKVRFKNRNVLIVNNEGITDYSSSIALGFIPWSDVEELYITKVNDVKFIEVAIKNEERYLEKLKGWQRKAIGINRKMGQQVVLINLTFTGHDPEEVLNVMQEAFSQHQSD